MARPTKGRILTVRISAPLERRLRGRARAAGSTPSEVVRELLEAELGEAASPYEKAKHLIGALDDRTVPAGRHAKAELRRWKPGRRG